MKWYAFVEVTAKNKIGTHVARGIWKIPDRQYDWPDRLAQIMAQVMDSVGDLGHVHEPGLVISTAFHKTVPDQAQTLEALWGEAEEPFFGVNVFSKLFWKFKG